MNSIQNNGNMKSKISSLIVALLLSSSFLFGQESQETNYVFVISKVNYLKAIDDAVESSKNGGLKIGDVKVILCGESVKVFQEKNSLLEKSLQNVKISIMACGLSLDQMKIDPSILPSNVKLVRNGLLEAMILESKGYSKYDM
jgi:intracellular sulfur oxidation DsrE/DsrF family protein